MGPSGSGKTTLLLIAGALLSPDGGEVLFEGKDLYAMGIEERASFRSKNIGFVFQQFHLMPYLSVLDNILIPAVASGAAGLKPRAETLAGKFGLAHRLRHLPSELSVGEKV